jgi:hypothetical protein
MRRGALPRSGRVAVHAHPSDIGWDAGALPVGGATLDTIGEIDAVTDFTPAATVPRHSVGEREQGTRGCWT